MNPTASPRPRLAALRLQEGGLLLVIFLLGLVLTLCGGTVKAPKFEKNSEGRLERVFTINAAGEKEPVLVERNKFLNAQNLAQLAKDTSFIAIMAVGATFIIIAGGIDLSVGSIYALASVLGALVFNGTVARNPDGGGLGGVLPGMLACVGAATLCGLLNGGMIVALRVHPFIITLGTMAIFRGVAFVITKGQSVGGFPQAFRDLVRWETGGGLSLVPLAVMLAVTVAGGIYLSRLAAGRRIYAVGGNELASKTVHWEFSGVHLPSTHFDWLPKH